MRGHPFPNTPVRVLLDDCRVAATDVSSDDGYNQIVGDMQAALSELQDERTLRRVRVRGWDRSAR